jgi:sodium pump decarboxylase gamma subunit
MQALAVGLRLGVLGMGLVFLVLGLLALLVSVIVRFDRRRALREADDSSPEAVARDPAREALHDPASNPELLAAAVVAVRAHRIHLRRQAAPALRAHLPGTLPSRWLGAGRTRQNRSFTPGGRYT